MIVTYKLSELIIGTYVQRVGDNHQAVYLVTAGQRKPIELRRVGTRLASGAMRGAKLVNHHTFNGKARYYYVKLQVSGEQPKALGAD